MSTTETRIPLSEAEVLAAEVVDLLRPVCARIEIAGSIRRRKADIGDIEIVCEPRFAVRLGGLFGDTEETVNLLDEEYLRLVAEGLVTHRPDKHGRFAAGSRYKRLAFRDVALDLFSVIEPAQWGVLFTIRTGPADFSHRLVTAQQHGGLMPPGCQVKDGALYRWGDLVPTPEEADFFEEIGLPFIKPAERS